VTVEFITLNGTLKEFIFRLCQYHAFYTPVSVLLSRIFYVFVYEVIYLFSTMDMY